MDRQEEERRLGLPRLGEQVPKRAYGRLLAWIGRRTLRAMGWRIEGALPDLPRVVIAIAPHSSNWDFIIGASLVFAIDVRASYIAKHTLFWGPLGRFLAWLGGIPVDRSRPEGMAESMIEAFDKNPQLWLAITPEGTRTDGAKFKSGFYRIAQAAKVPILPMYFNYRKKVLGFLPPLEPGADTARGVHEIRELLEHHGARRPK